MPSGLEQREYEHVDTLERGIFCIQCGTEAVDISNVPFGNKGAEMIAKAISRNNTLVGLRLCRNNIADEGAVALAKALRSNLTLKELIVSNNYIRLEGARA
eukprot:CAMPEP_0184058144 /NCGR_PEP_ID=MMETSP0956-20121227/9018_1 /TAXON_ID=627963 /ORGANISM="Aplanochytrium sp, Strain PBS07" /LENGTH=100 /DNA_ID=CAMNT_0026352945 /DNA_START=180 /DNA_END=478 /DNA_ORIENTATION=+